MLDGTPSVRQKVGLAAGLDAVVTGLLTVCAAVSQLHQRDEQLVWHGQALLILLLEIPSSTSYITPRTW